MGKDKRTDKITVNVRLFEPAESKVVIS